MEVQYKVEIKDEEVEGFDRAFAKALTFDIVSPTLIIGEVGNYFTDIDITMSNGDQLSYKYTENPAKDFDDILHALTINGQKFEARELGDDPAFFIRSQYMKHLQKKIMKVEDDTNE